MSFFIASAMAQAQTAPAPQSNPMITLLMFGGMLNIGRRPTVQDEGNISVEVNVFDFAGDLYGKEIEVLFHSRIREERKFDHIDQLKEQLQKDKHSGLQSFSKAIARVLKSYIPDGTKSQSDKTCGSCGVEGLIYREGCVTCSSCGWSKC